jgi:uncharacterized phage-like protein YoqJ
MKVNMNKKDIIIAVSGHRQLKHSYNDVYNLTKSILLKINPALVYQGCAIGFDQLVAKVCIDSGIPFVAAIPCEGQEKLWPEKVQEEYHEMLKHAREKVVVSKGKYHHGMMHKRNDYMIQQANYYVIYCDPNETTGGTKSFLDKVKNKKHINIFSYLKSS